MKVIMIATSEYNIILKTPNWLYPFLSRVIKHLKFDVKKQEISGIKMKAIIIDEATS